MAHWNDKRDQERLKEIHYWLDTKYPDDQVMRELVRRFEESGDITDWQAVLNHVRHVWAEEKPR